MLQPSIESWGELFLRSMEHHFNVELATVFGVEKAIIIHNLYFWINHNAKNKVHIHDGSVWTFNSSSAFAKLFPYIKERTISRYLVELEKSNIIITGNYNINSFDKTKWYAFSVPFLSELEKLGYDITDIDICQNVQFDTHKMANGYTQNNEPIPYNKQADSKQEEKEEERDKSLSKKEHIDYNAIVKCWNETNPTLSNVKMLNNKRKEQIRSLLASNNATVDDLMKAIKIISMSSFCQGKNDRNWRASFDWLIKDTKSCFSRLFEGAYAFTQDEKNKLRQYLGETANGGNPTLPKGWEQERYDMYIRNGYTITEDGRLFKDGREIK